jgi:hypothetical protein
MVAMSQGQPTRFAIVSESRARLPAPRDFSILAFRKAGERFSTSEMTALLVLYM